MRLKVHKTCILRFTILTIAINLILLLVVLTLNPTLYSWSPSLKHDVFSENLYVVFAGEGWIIPPQYLHAEYINIRLIVGNITMDLARIELVSNLTPTLFEFNVSKEFRREDFNISMFPDIKLYMDVKGYVPIPASVVTVMDNGCYLLYYYLPEQLNATINLCYFYANPTLTIYNEETGYLEVLLELHKGSGDITEEQHMVKPHSTETIQYKGLIRPLIREEKLKYVLFDATIEDNKSIIRLSNIQHIAFTVINILLIPTALISCRSRGKKNKQLAGKNKLRRSQLGSTR